MNVKEREKFYDERIAPELARLSKLCTDNGLSMLAVVEFDKNEAGESGYGRTLGLAKGSSDSIRWMDAFVQSNANFERYCLGFMRHCVTNKIPHTSMCLQQLGIEPDPKDREGEAQYCPRCGRQTGHKK